MSYYDGLSYLSFAQFGTKPGLLLEIINKSTSHRAVFWAMGDGGEEEEDLTTIRNYRQKFGNISGQRRKYDWCVMKLLKQLLTFGIGYALVIFIAYLLSRQDSWSILKDNNFAAVTVGYLYSVIFIGLYLWVIANRTNRSAFALYRALNAILIISCCVIWWVLSGTDNISASVEKLLDVLLILLCITLAPLIGDNTNRRQFILELTLIGIITFEKFLLAYAEMEIYQALFGTFLLIMISSAIYCNRKLAVSQVLGR